MSAPNWTMSMYDGGGYELDLGLLELEVVEDRGAPWRWRVKCAATHLAWGKESSRELAQAAAVRWAREMLQLGLLRLGPAVPVEVSAETRAELEAARAPEVAAREAARCAGLVECWLAPETVEAVKRYSVTSPDKANEMSRCVCEHLAHDLTVVLWP